MQKHSKFYWTIYIRAVVHSHASQSQVKQAERYFSVLKNNQMFAVTSFC